MRSPLFIALFLFGTVLVLSNTFFIVPQTKQAIVLQYGKQQRVINQWGRNEPGLYMKTPFVQDVIFFDKRNIGYTLSEREIVGRDQERLVVDAFVRYRIVDPLKFLKEGGTEALGVERISSSLENELRETLGSADTADIVSTQRAALMKRIAQQMGEEVASLGVQVIDVRIRQADFVKPVQDRVFERMRSERQKVAARIRAEGERNSTVIEAKATEEAQKIKGEGDAKRAELFRQSYGRDPEFAAFYRSMQAYDKALPKGTPMYVSPDSEFFRYMRDKGGR